jgi:hypothetical protein
MAKTKKAKGKKSGKKAFVVKRSVAQKLFVFLGYDGADTWTAARIMQKMPKAVELIDEDTKAKDKEVNALIKALRDDGDIVDKMEIDDDGGMAKGGKKGKVKDEKAKKGKGKKKSSKDDDEDEDDEDDEEDDEDEDDEDDDDSDDDDEESDEDDEEDDDEDDDDDADEDDSDDDDDEDSDDDEDDDDESDDDEEDEDMEDDDDKKSKKKKGKKGKAGKADKKSGKKGGKKGGKVGSPGVSSKIIEILKGASSNSPVTKKDVLKEVKKAFKGKDEDEIKKRVGSVLRTSFMKRRGLKLESDDDGGFWIKKAKKSKD